MRIKSYTEFSILEKNKEDLRYEVEGELEDMVKEKFMADLYGEKPDCETDADTQVGPGGLEYIAWVEIKDVDAAVIKKIDDDYEAFAKPFEEWCKKAGYWDPNITTGDGENTVQYTVTYKD